MADTESLKPLFRELHRTGQLDPVLALIAEEFKLSEIELRTHLLDTPLVDVPAVAQTHMLQGRMKACETLLARLRTLAGIGAAPPTEK